MEKQNYNSVPAIIHFLVGGGNKLQTTMTNIAIKLSVHMVNF